MSRTTARDARAGNASSTATAPIWTFNIADQPLQGYVRTTQRQKWVDPRYKRYLGWKGLVRLLANVAGVPGALPPDCRALVSCSVTWKRKARLDGDNFLKGLLDSLWPQDRRVMELHYVAFERAGVERASVTVKIEGGEQCGSGSRIQSLSTRS